MFLSLAESELIMDSPFVAQVSYIVPVNFFVEAQSMILPYFVGFFIITTLPPIESLMDPHQWWSFLETLFNLRFAMYGFLNFLLSRHYLLTIISILMTIFLDPSFQSCISYDIYLILLLITLLLPHPLVLPLAALLLLFLMLMPYSFLYPISFLTSASSLLHLRWLLVQAVDH